MSKFWYWDSSRIISLILACCIILTVGEGSFDWRDIHFLIPSVLLIWFGNELDKILPSKYPYRALGWIFLLGIFFMRLSELLGK